MSLCERGCFNCPALTVEMEFPVYDNYGNQTELSSLARSLSADEQFDIGKEVKPV
jgi:hypothetical protein